MRIVSNRHMLPTFEEFEEEVKKYRKELEAKATKKEKVVPA